MTIKAPVTPIVETLNDGTEIPPGGVVEIPPVVEADKVKTPEELQADIDKWKAMSRKHEADAKTNAAKAKQLDALEESQKTELQKIADRADTAEKALAEVTTRALRSEVAAAKGLPATALPLVVGNTQEEIEASVDALVAFRGAVPKPDMGAGDTRGGDINGKTDFDTRIAEANKVGDIQLSIRLKEAKHAEENKKK